MTSSIASQPSPISPTIDFDTDGKHTGHLQLPHSHDGSAYGSVMIPVAVIKNGAAPARLARTGPRSPFGA